MALSVTNAQGTKVYVAAAAGTAVADATEIGTAIAAGDQIGCIQDLGSIGTTRSVQEYSCLSADETAKSTGSISLGNFTVGMLFNAADTAGQATLRSIYAANATRTFIIELNDNGGTNPTYITFEAFVSGQELSAQKDNAVMLTSTVEIASVPVYVDAA